MKVLVAGIIARYPFGGVTWCSLMYLLGLRALGHEVLYIEDTGECIYDPEQNTRSEDPSYGTRYIHNALEPFGLGDRWCFVNYDGSYHGVSKARVQAFCADAELYINLSGGSWFWRDEYLKIPHRVFIDTDPVFTQLAIAKAEGWYVDFFKTFDHLFTFGANIGTPASDVPDGGFTWHKTWQPVTLDQWRTDAPPAHDAFTTVMTWKIESFTDVDGNKDKEFVKVIDLPSRVGGTADADHTGGTADADRTGGTANADPALHGSVGRDPRSGPAAPGINFLLAINGPQKLLREYGWTTVDAMGVSRSLWDYRQFIQDSKGEFGVAKNAYVERRSGWFSDRTECYLAAGRPAIVQDTGWSAHLPHGLGLLPFSTPEEALDALRRVSADWDVHSKAASEIARAHFDANVVLPRLIEMACRDRSADPGLR